MQMACIGTADLFLLSSFRSIRFLLTDTKIPRDTKTLVAGVAARKAADPARIDALLAEVQSISDQAIALLDGNVSRSEQVQKLQALVDRNHAVLNDLGVGHAALEAIRQKTAQKPYGLHTKLTGAGGGGCAVTLVPDDFSEDTLQLLKAELAADGFVCYETQVGGHGVGIASVQQAGKHASAEGGAEEEVVPVKKQFEATTTAELARWSETVGRWAFA